MIQDARGYEILNSEKGRSRRLLPDEDFAHIVRCVNLHEELVGFIKSLVEHEFYDPRALNSFGRVVLADAAKNLLPKAKA